MRKLRAVEWAQLTLLYLLFPYLIYRKLWPLIRKYPRYSPRPFRLLPKRVPREPRRPHVFGLVRSEPPETDINPRLVVTWTCRLQHLPASATDRNHWYIESLRENCPYNPIWITFRSAWSKRPPKTQPSSSSSCPSSSIGHHNGPSRLTSSKARDSSPRWTSSSSP